jgi:hypothetical protein
LPGYNDHTTRAAIVKETTMGSTASGIAPQPVDAGPAVHDFDFYMGSWRVHHRRLKERLAGSDEWQEFDGTSTAWPLLEGAGNVDDNLLEAPAGTYRAISLRSFDPATNQWSIWWLDGRNPGQLDPPVVGGFEDGIGTFIAEDTFNGTPILVRFIWSDITPTTCRWEQAFSTDRGETWEVNWVMESTRVE